MSVAVGRTARRHNGIGSWLAYGPALAIAAAWLLPVQADRTTAWALPLGLAIGATATVAGGARRLSGPLVGGVLLSAAVVFIAIGSDVAAVPAWAWFALGGLALLGAASLIERRTRDARSVRQLLDTWD